MSEAHLGKGSKQPPKVDGKIRLYSMEYCPYAQRTRLVLRAKKIPHDIVNINLNDKPEWYFKIHPEGKVPALDDGSKITIESLDISDYLDDKYPEPPLYPKDPVAKLHDKELIAKISSITSLWAQSIFNKEKESAEHWALRFKVPLDVFEEELAKKGTTFFGGNQPGMVDYMLWPWAERAEIVKFVHGIELFATNCNPKLSGWCEAMRQQPVVKEMYHKPGTF